VGVSIVKKPGQLKPALRQAWRHGRAVVERFIAGRELTVGILGSRALPVIEILPQKADFYDMKSKYAPGGSVHLCPAPIPASVARQAQAWALKAHQALGCKGYSRTDMIMDRQQQLWVLELNTLPGMTPVSLFPEAAKAAGISYPNLLKEMIRLS
jgi:D-alanine-D-alanine ligase